MKKEFYDLIIRNIKQDYYTDIQNIQAHAKGLISSSENKAQAQFAQQVIDLFKKIGLI